MIGGTPAILIDDPDGQIIAKAEFLQPGASIKDRAALAVVEGARSRGSLKPGRTVVEMTSGNMGAALAVVCGVLEHPFVAVMSAGNSPERATMMRGLGAEVILVPQVDGAAGHVTGADISVAAERAAQIARDRSAFYVDQFANDDCVIAHETTTGPELCDEFGAPDAFAACVGTGATLIGVARALKRRGSTSCFAVEPAGAAVLAGEPVTKAQHILQGTGYARIPPLWDPSVVDGYLSIDDASAAAERNRLGRMGLYVGFSSGANVAAARTLLRSGRFGKHGVVATVLCDSGLKYSECSLLEQ